MTEKDDALVPRPEKGAAAAIELADGMASVRLKTLEDLLRFSRMYVKSRFAPDGMDESGVAIAIQSGAELGLGIATSVRSFVVVKGNLSMRGEAALALLRGPRGKHALVPGTLKAWVAGEGDQRMGVCVSRRIGYQEDFRTEFSVRDAKTAGLTGKDNWKHYQDRQLRWRSIGHHCKDYYSDVVGGFPLAEEVQDWQDLGPRRGETPATRQGPPPKADPLLGAIGIDAKPVDAEVVEAEPIQEPEEPDGFCVTHEDTELDEDGVCWKCEAESEERREADAEE